MSFSRGLKWFIILLLPLTLVWKIAARVSYPNAPTQPGIDARVSEFLIRQHFSVAPLERGLDENPIIRATAGQCRMLVSVSSPVAWDRDTLGSRATADDRVFVVFGGRIYAQQPTWLTVSDFLWFRIRRELGWNVQPTVILTVVANPTCEADRLPWGEFS